MHIIERTTIEPPISEIATKYNVYLKGLGSILETPVLLVLTFTQTNLPNFTHTHTSVF